MDRPFWQGYRPPKPAWNEPGTLGEQLEIVLVALRLAEELGCSPREVWQMAREQVLRHAGGRLQ